MTESDTCRAALEILEAARLSIETKLTRIAEYRLMLLAGDRDANQEALQTAYVAQCQLIDELIYAKWNIRINERRFDELTADSRRFEDLIKGEGLSDDS